jgi:hypothetical protein
MTTIARELEAPPRFRGERITPADDAYEDLRRLRDRRTDRRPAIIARPVASSTCRSRRPRAAARPRGRRSQRRPRVLRERYAVSKVDHATVRRAFGDTCPRLAEIKKRYDPDIGVSRRTDILPPRDRGEHMPRGFVPEHVDAFLRGARPAIIGSLLADGSPSTVPTWYLWLGESRFMLSHQDGGFRARNLARDGRVALTVLGDDWYDHVSLRGTVVELRADPEWSDLDTICRHYRGIDYPRDADYTPSTAIVRVETWHEFHSSTRP